MHKQFNYVVRPGAAIAAKSRHHGTSCTIVAKSHLTSSDSRIDSDNRGIVTVLAANKLRWQYNIITVNKSAFLEIAHRVVAMTGKSHIATHTCCHSHIATHTCCHARIATHTCCQQNMCQPPCVISGRHRETTLVSSVTETPDRNMKL